MLSNLARALHGVALVVKNTPIPLMNTQIYLSQQVLHHYGLLAADLKSDTNTPLSFDWSCLWRCDYLIGTEDTGEHIFLFTNAVTRYSILLTENEEDIHLLLDAFHDQLMQRFQPLNDDHTTLQWWNKLDLFSDSAATLKSQMDVIAETCVDRLIACDGQLDYAENHVNNMQGGNYSPKQKTSYQMDLATSTSMRHNKKTANGSLS